MATAMPLARPYRDFLTPSLHRRFMNAILLTLGVCFVESLWMSQWTSIIWTLFPLGRSGIRSLLLLISILPIYILRVEHMHVGVRTTVSPFNNVISNILRISTAQTLLWYSFSAWFFCEVYMWSASGDSKLSMVDPERPNERSKLNERPIYLRSMFLMLAVVQAAFHVAQDYDQITYPILKAISAVSPGAQQQSASPLVQIRDRLVAVLHNAAIRSLFTTVFGTLWYTLFLRKTAWYGTFTIAQFIFTLPKNSKPPRYPQTIGDLLGRFFVEAFLLGLLWEFANVAFSTFVAQEPTKNGAPLTSDSKDPNGSLLAGLKSKKELPRSTAFWELALIAHRYPVRRQLIYKDIDRIGGSAWSQVLTICLAELHGIVKRVQDFHNPPKPTSLSNGQPLSATGTLPRIASPMRQDNVLKNPPPANGVTGAVASNAGTFTKAFGLSPGAEDPVIPRAKKLLTYGTDHFLIKEQQAQVSQSGLVAVAQEYFVRFLKSPLGEPFRTTFGRRALTVVLGTPTGSLSVIADAITGLSNIAVRSLKEDPYGKVQADVANIIRVFTSTAEVLESFLSKLPVHWTDVEFVEKQRRNIPEVETVLANLRAGLRDLINEFGEFREDLGLNRIELRRAKEVVSRSEKQSEELR